MVHMNRDYVAWLVMEDVRTGLKLRFTMEPTDALPLVTFDTFTSMVKLSWVAGVEHRTEGFSRISVLHIDVRSMRYAHELLNVVQNWFLANHGEPTRPFTRCDVGVVKETLVATPCFAAD